MKDEDNKAELECIHVKFASMFGQMKRIESIQNILHFDVLNADKTVNVASERTQTQDH